MKKILTGASSALAGLLLAAPAAAQGEAETMMTLGGYTNYTIAFTDYANGGVDKTDGIAVFNNTEIFFSGSGETDGGLQVTARVELEGGADGDQIDEHWIALSGDFGSVELGANDGADERANAGIFYNSSAVDTLYWNWLPVPNHFYKGPGTYNDGMGITYTSPSVGGGQFIVGYKPSRESEETANTGSGKEDILTLGLKYSGDLGGTAVKASLGYGTGTYNPGANTMFTALTPENDGRLRPDDDERDYSKWGIGVTVGLAGGITLYARHEVEELDWTETRTNNLPMGDGSPSREATFTNLEVSYSMGPMTLGLGYVTGKVENNSYNPAVDASGLDDDIGGYWSEFEDQAIVASVDYDMGGGVTGSAFIAWGDAEENAVGCNPEGFSGSAFPDADDLPATCNSNADADADGTAFGIALNLAF